MKYIDRLEGTEYEHDVNARLICAALDLCNAVNGDMPKVRHLCDMLDSIRTDGKNTSTKTASAYLKKMSDIGIISLVIGTGRKRNEYSKPENGGLVADKKADLERRQEDFRKEVWRVLNEDGMLGDMMKKGLANKEGVMMFIEYYAAETDGWMMEKERLEAENGARFIIKMRWRNWKSKIGQRTTDYGQRTTDNGLRTTDNGLRTTDKGQALWSVGTGNKTAKQRKAEREELDRMMNEWLKKKGKTMDDYVRDEKLKAEFEAEWLKLTMKRQEQ